MAAKKARQGYGAACGKVILFGEHSVVYGHPAIAVPVSSIRTTVILQPSSRDRVETSQYIRHTTSATRRFSMKSKAAKAIKALNEARRQLNILAGKFKIHIISTIPPESGLGSSAALTVAMTRALANYSGKEISPGRTAAAACELEKIFHGTPSGIDTAVISHQKPVFLIKGKKPRFIRIKPLKIIIADTGQKSETRKIVREVRNRRDTKPGLYDAAFREMGRIAWKAKAFLENGDHARTAELMNRNQELLRKIGVSSTKIEAAIKAAIRSGSPGAKLSGAGKGGCVIIMPGNEPMQTISTVKKHSTSIFLANL